MFFHNRPYPSQSQNAGDIEQQARRREQKADDLRQQLAHLVFEALLQHLAEAQLDPAVQLRSLRRGPGQLQQPVGQPGPPLLLLFCERPAG